MVCWLWLWCHITNQSIAVVCDEQWHCWSLRFTWYSRNAVCGRRLLCPRVTDPRGCCIVLFFYGIGCVSWWWVICFSPVVLSPSLCVLVLFPVCPPTHTHWFDVSLSLLRVVHDCALWCVCAYVSPPLGVFSLPLLLLCVLSLE